MQEPEEREKRAAYPAPDFQRLFGVGNTKFHEEKNAGRLKVRYLGRKILIDHEDAMAWLKSLPERVPSKQRAA